MVFGLFSKDKALQRVVEKATNKLAQQPDRWGAMERLAEDGSDAALFGLCKRWSVTSLKGVEDEQEKNWVADTMVGKGAAALEPLIRYMKTAEQLAIPLMVLEKIADKPRVLAVADELFKGEPPGYVRMPDRRIELIRWFGEWKAVGDDEVIPRLAPYFTDFDENSRFSAIEAMHGRDAKQIAKPLIDALVRPEEESGRIKRTILEVLERGKVPLGDRAGDVAGALAGGGPLANDFRVDAGVVKKR
jgi:hypothetical protein